MANGAPAIGIDVGGTKIAGAVVAADGSIIARNQIATDADSPNAILTGMVKLAQELRSAAPAACAVGVGAAGLVDVERGVILAAPNISYRNLTVADELRRRTGLPAFVDNDANVAAWAEARFGAGRGVANQIMVTVGTGIGGGYIFDGAMYRGGFGFASEVGHMVFDPAGPPCGCGSRGCWEVMASGSAIGRIARERAGEASGSLVLKNAGDDVSAITGELVGEAGLDGDAFAVSVLAEAGRNLGIGLATLVNLFDPELLVIGGGAGTGTGDLLLGPAKASMEEYTTLREFRTPVRVEIAALGNDAGVVGAADLARASLGE
jgi:glucokinase